MLEFVVTDDFSQVRLDKFVRGALPNVPLSHLFKMIRTKKIRVNGSRGRPELLLQAGDKVSIWGDKERLTAHEETPAPTETGTMPPLLFEDDWLLAIDKPSGLAVHPGTGIRHGTVVDIVRNYLGVAAERNGFRASPAHRLDRETSGVLLVAKRRKTMVHLTEVFTRRTAKKSYVALVKGKLSTRQGLIDLPLADRQQSAVSKARNGTTLQPALTRWSLLGQNSEAALVRCTIETGRTHQIRRHFASIGHPVLGDTRHGDFPLNRTLKSRWGLDRLFLHAMRLEFPHPADGRKVTIEAALPQELTAVLDRAAIGAP